MAQTVTCRVLGKSVTLDYTPVAEVDGGMVVVQNDILGITNQQIPAGRKGTISTECEIEGPKDSTDMSTVGTDVFWDSTDGVFTTTATANFAGKNTTSAGASATTVRIKLQPQTTGSSSVPGLTATSAQLNAAAAISNGSNVFNVKAYGATGNGTTDDYTAVMAAINACYAAGGGTVYFPCGTYFISGKITIPNNEVEVVVDNPTGVGYRNVPMRLTGDGADFYSNLNSHNATGGTILNLAYAEETPDSNLAKIESFGLGTLEIDHLTLMDDSDGTTNFFYSTLTTCNIHDVFVRGRVSRWHDASYPAQDAFTFGGTNQASESGRDSGFQGYGTKVVGCYFDNIRRAVYERTWANSIIVERNTTWNGCGGVAPFEVLGETGGAVPLVAGGVFANNLIEGYYYQFGFKLANAEQFTFIGNSMWDIFTTEGDFDYIYRFESTASYNTIFGGFNDTSDAKYLVSDAGTGNKYFTFNGIEGTSLVFGPVTINQTGTKGMTLNQGTGTAGGPAFYLYRGAVLCGEIYMYGTADSGTYHLYMQSDTGKVVLAPKAGSTVNITTLPTSSTGLVAGDLWNNSGVINIKEA